MSQLPTHALVTLTDGSIKPLYYLEEQNGLIHGATATGRPQTSITIPQTNIETIQEATEQRVTRIRHLQAELDRLTDPDANATESHLEYRSGEVAPHLAPTPISSDATVNKWYRLVSSLQQSDTVIIRSDNHQRKSPLTLTADPEFPPDKPTLAVQLEGPRGGTYQLTIDAVNGTATMTTHQNGDWTRERPINDLVIVLSKNGDEAKVKIDKNP